MKKSHISLFSFIAITFASLFVYQNCSKQGFSTVQFSQGKGTIIGMDENGVIQGEVIVPDCDDQECPAEIPVKFETFDGGNNIGDTVATPVVDGGNNPNNPGTGTPPTGGPVSYVFEFDVPNEYMCQQIVVMVYPPGGAPYELVFNNLTPQWGGSATCGFNITPLVTVENVKQDGTVIYVDGKCVSVPQGVDVVGNVMGINNNIKCVGGRYRLCAHLDQPQLNSTITVNQTINGTTSPNVTNQFSTQRPAIIVIAVTQVIKNNLNATIKGKCTPGGHLKFTIYGQLQGELTCPDTGMFTFTDVQLVNTTPRILYIEMQTPFAQPVTIEVDVDQTTTPNCSIATTINNNFCVDSAGTITGACQTGLPVLVYVDDVLQGVAYCKNEAFSIDNVILNNNMGTTASTVRIEQHSGNTGAVCTASQTMSKF